jgi:hypothetical protein
MVEELGHEVWLGHPTEIAAALVGATRMIGVMRNSFEDI